MSDNDKPTPIPADPAPRHGRLQQLRLRWAAPTPGGRDAYETLRRHVALRLLAGSPDLTAPPRPRLQTRLDGLLFEDKIVLKRAEKQRLLDDMLVDVYGLGPLEGLLAEEDVQEIVVRGPEDIKAIIAGEPCESPRLFYDEAHLAHVLRRLQGQADADGRVTLGGGMVAYLRTAGAPARSPVLVIKQLVEGGGS